MAFSTEVTAHTTENLFSSRNWSEERFKADDHHSERWLPVFFTLDLAWAPLWVRASDYRNFTHTEKISSAAAVVVVGHCGEISKHIRPDFWDFFCYDHPACHYRWVIQNWWTWNMGNLESAEKWVEGKSNKAFLHFWDKFLPYLLIFQNSASPSVLSTLKKSSNMVKNKIGKKWKQVP